MEPQSRVYKATPEPWKLPRNHHWWCPKNDPFHIPRALRRAKWTKAEWKRHREAQQLRRRGVGQHIVTRTDDEIFAKVKARKAEKEKRGERKLERLELKAQRQRRRREKIEQADRVLECIVHGSSTTGRIMKSLGFDKRIVQRALRLLLKEQKVEKTSARVYVVYGRKRVPGSIPRKRFTESLPRRRF